MSEKEPRNIADLLEKGVREAWTKAYTHATYPLYSRIFGTDGSVSEPRKPPTRWQRIRKRAGLLWFHARYWVAARICPEMAENAELWGEE